MQQEIATTPWMTTAEAAEYLRRSPNTLEGWRSSNKGPPYHRPMGGGGILYHREELDAWMRSGSAAEDAVAE